MGVWEQVIPELTNDADNQYLMLHSILLRAHQQAATGKGGSNHALARSRNGLTAKIHMLADPFGRPLMFLLAVGQSHGILAAPILL